ncbi:hypothetical protein VOLCADRAFT_103729 [Volvox carteri f. nagariensis]|uniref:Secreted protein n=1 Tax=Volvox carteri f. nagariensis TaxID=3068 RepID=D8TN70_VOLCA|nr:uncharacterized protein VOLCADRAFT_103729 [Volvox carteri f. nagariensis]EFJ50939.1 hypothetical protein VOLCADRAFT_103729 [Volvox carteri f. nagariensis]|eukprot:XP_002947951.1 hypothetical protein VOLCADRAFT_103729 [Volvox carteri f. nagariensis]
MQLSLLTRLCLALCYSPYYQGTYESKPMWNHWCSGVIARTDPLKEQTSPNGAERVMSLTIGAGLCRLLGTANVGPLPVAPALYQGWCRWRPCGNLKQACHATTTILLVAKTLE